MNIKTIIVTIFSILIASPVFAIDYPEIGGMKISNTTTAAEFIIYLFYLGIAVGAFIAVIMIIMAGIEWLTSSGNPSKVESAKGKITNTLLGVCILFGCYLILNTINSQLTTIKIDDLRCEHGLVVLMKESKGGKEKCIDSNQKDIGGTILSTLKWKFPEDYLLKVYTYPEVDYKGTPTELNCASGACSGNISSDTKSIYFVLNNPGIYLYNSVDYGVGTKSYPRFITKSVSDLSNLESFDNLVKSIEIIDPDQSQKIQYRAVIFKDQNFRGRCAFVGQSNSNLDNFTPGNGFYTDRVGNDTISSIIIAKSNLNQSAIIAERGEVILYTKTNCGKSENNQGLTEEEKKKSGIKECHLKISSGPSGHLNILGSCPGFIEGDSVQSFEITGPAGLVLSNSAVGQGNEYTKCQYFSKASIGEGTCYTSILNESIYTIGGKIPESFIIIPDN